jgi:histidinol-phosphate phosphatase family protein
MNRPKQVVILCGGLGTRLLPYTENLPKPMVSCNSRPFLHYLLNQMSSQGLKNFVLLTGYLGESIKNYFGDGTEWGWSIQYSNGPIEWDTGKRIWEAKPKLDDCFMLLYSDNFTQFSLEKVFNLHQKNQTALTFVVSPKSPGNVSLDDSNFVKSYNNKRSESSLDFVEIGYMIIEKNRLFNYYLHSECSFSSILEEMVQSNEVSAWVQNDNYHSISDPKRWRDTEQYLASKKIILIDRDGVINKKSKKGEYISYWDDFEWISNTIEGMQTLAKKGFKFIVISNQAGIARNMIKSEELKKIHSNMQKILLDKGVEILDIYICPHHWDEECYCRKPNPGMFHKVSNDWNLRLDKTLFIGDDYRDCQASYNAGCKSILIGDISQSEKLLEHEQPIYKNIRLTQCISTILKFFNSNNRNDNN